MRSASRSSRFGRELEGLRRAGQSLLAVDESAFEEEGPETAVVF